MTPELARILFDPVSYLPAWRGVELADRDRSAVNALLIRQYALPGWREPEPQQATATHRLVDAWAVLDIAAGLMGCAALRRTLVVDANWTAMSPRVHEFVLAEYHASFEPAGAEVVHIGQAVSHGARFLLGFARSLPGWLLARLALRYGLTTEDALPDDRTCLWNALKHAKRYPDISDFASR